MNVKMPVDSNSYVQEFSPQFETHILSLARINSNALYLSQKASGQLGPERSKNLELVNAVWGPTVTFYAHSKMGWLGWWWLGWWCGGRGGLGGG